jgi:hypothetical protein
MSTRRCIRSVAAAHRACNARVFGSALRGDDAEQSDLDILVDPRLAATLVDIGAIRLQLARLLGVPVDMLTPWARPRRMRDEVLEQAQPI